MSDSHKQYYDLYRHHDYSNSHYPAGPPHLAHPHSTPLPGYYGQPAYSPPTGHYATPPSINTPLVLEVRPEDVKQSVESNKKRKTEGMEEEASEEKDDMRDIYVMDPLYLRQQILDNAVALTQSLCPTIYGPHNGGRYSIVLLQTASRNTNASLSNEAATSQATPHSLTGGKWRAGVACDGVLVVEGPEMPGKSMAMNMLLDSLAKRLARSIPRAWDVGSAGEEDDDDDDDEERTGVVEDKAGARFAVEGVR
ncbi:hypothetical protein LTR62_000451 [Meristemomyces frigidus]|uniref:Uncharacterized protein n=1 Tax=Meristemomyces frigidus TaxID=1508187 RepID=A0AAN7TU26_9PEZI|nr:hypothetical protein LTR62_000451 [Meristemomyces frigidus]